MLTRIDHVMICVPDLQQGIDTYTRLGFNVSPGGVHPGQGTHNAIAFHEEDYLELLSVRDRDEYLAGHPGGGLLEFLAQGGGFRYIAVQSDDLVADVAQMRQRGVDVSDPSEGGRQTPTGQALRWKAATLGPRHPLPIFFIEHLTPLPERRLGGAGRHASQRSAPCGSRVHCGGGRGSRGGDLQPRARDACAEGTARCGHQSGHGSFRPRADGPDSGAARRAWPGG